MRITGGRHRSRRLEAPRGQATRPTSDRVREALFGILGARLELAGASVLDLYAGTGALALEALSRGAARATVVERGREALAALRANVASLGLAGEVRVVAGPVERAAAGLAGGAFDLVFVDPPYADVASGVALRALEAIVQAGALTQGALVVLEHAPLRGQDGERLEEGGLPYRALPDSKRAGTGIPASVSSSGGGPDVALALGRPSLCILRTSPPGSRASALER